MTTTLRAPSPARFLSLVPHLVGCTPRESLVLVPFHHGRSLGALRLDLPAAGEDDARYAATAIGMICRVRDADALAIVVYTQEPFRSPTVGEPTGPSRRTLVERIRGRADDCGLPVLSAHLVAGDGWGPYDATTPRPLAQIAPSPDVLGVSGTILRDQHAGIALPRIGKVARQRVAAALSELQRAGDDDAAAPGPRERSSAFDDLPDVLEDALSWDPADLHPAEAAFLAFVLGRPALRDVALTQWSADLESGRRALAWQLRFLEGRAGVPDDPLRLAGQGDPPDARRLRRGLELARVVAASVAVRERVGPLASAAWLSWALGNSTHASGYVSQALRIDPAYGLAQLVGTMVANAYLPAWAFEGP